MTRYICAWCKCEIAPPDGTADDDIISHGICEECSEFVMAGMEAIVIKVQKSELGINKEI